MSEERVALVRYRLDQARETRQIQELLEAAE
jgi:hypothetical protein